MNYNFVNDFPYMYRQREVKSGKMKMNGIGTVKVEPDTAIINFGIITEDKVLQKAQKENSIITTRVINYLKSMGIDEKDITTTYYNVEAQYDYIEGEKIFRSYKVTNRLSVTIRNLDMVGEIVDGLTKNGVNEISNINFTVYNKSKYYRKALNIAVEDAIVKALDIGKTLNVNVDDVPWSIEEQSYYYENVQDQSLKLAAVPIMPGQVKITAKIQAIFRYI
ncbi:SIMPL domain-containing protein [Haloimpatiens sp. FM7330]|uniref:SIMPL domain-containing protein n=1 Tax=Haloimpatiens sp. FM7330 TaxID=3298610 RepID=UPI00363BAC63